MRNFFQRVLVAAGDVTEEADLLRYAQTLQGIAPGAEFHFVHVLGWAARPRFHEEPATYAGALRLLEESVAQYFGSASRARCSVRHGNVVDSLLETAAELAADLILIGHSQEHSRRRSTARRLAMQAPCPLWMKPRNSVSTVGRILAAIDYSEPSSYALSMACHIARMAGKLDCLALHVYLNEGSMTVEEYRAMDRAREREAFDRFTAPLDTAGIDVQPLLEESASVVHAVDRLTESHGVDLVVMGSRGQSPSLSTLLGSESEQVLMESKVPVLIAKRRGERIGLLQALLDRDFRVHEPPLFG